MSRISQSSSSSPTEGCRKRFVDEEAWAVNRDAAVELGGEGDPHLANSLRWAANWAAHQRLQMAHHVDVAQGLLRLLYAPGVLGRIYNIADDAPVTAVELHQLNGVGVPADMHTRTDPDPWFGLMSTERIRRDLGFRPHFPTVWSARDAGAL